MKEKVGPAVPAFLGTKPQNFRAFGTFGALGPPVGTQPQVPIGLFKRRRLQGPDRAQAKRPAVVARADCMAKGRNRKRVKLIWLPCHQYA